MSDTAKSCKAGYYYCFTDKKCKKIPLGWHVGRRGYISKDDDDGDDNKDNGNGDGGNGNGGSEGGNGGGDGGGGMGESWIDLNNPKINEEKHDHEHEMIRRQMDTVTSAAKRLKKKVGNKGEGNVKAWVQSKITKAADYIDTAADYMDSDVKEELDKRDKPFVKKLVKNLRKGSKTHAKQADKLEKAVNEENIDEAGKKCWKGYKKAGTQKLFGKTYNRCVKKEENESIEGNLEEGNKSGDTSLRDWFSKSRSSDGTPGWVQLGGKYAGKPCAKQPGQKTKPKCGSSKMKRNLDKKEEDKAFRRKNRQDPNPDRKGKAKNVATEEVVLENQSSIDRRNQEIQRKQIQLDRQKIALKRKMVQVDKTPVSNDELSLKVRESAEMRYCPKCQKNETRDECSFGPKYWDTYSKPAIKEEEKKKKRDACYHKVKSRYSVWPSAYASGALVKCRKVGAKNWGNSKKEEVEFEKVVEFLYVEGFTKTVDDAAQMAMHLSESWVDEILKG